MTIRLPLLLMFALALSTPLFVFGAEPITLTFGSNEEAKTIGDLKPKFLPYEKKQAPEASIEYVMKRYRALFESALTPEIKIDTLNRLNNLSASFGVKQKNLTVDPSVQNKVILGTYQEIMETGSTYQKMDELLYQTAKATAQTGDILESIRRLELLIALYPDSILLNEALFRLAENYFDLAEFEKALEQYKRLSKRKLEPKLDLFTDYKLAWSRYRQERTDRAVASISDIFASYPKLKSISMNEDYSSYLLKDQRNTRLDLPPAGKVIEDSARLLAIIVDAQAGVPQIRESAAALGDAKYEPFVLRSINEFYQSKKRFYESAQLTENYVYGNAAQLGLVDFAHYAIASYEKGEHLVEAWTSKTKFVDHYGLRSEFWTKAGVNDRTKMLAPVFGYTQELAHLNFVRMQQQKRKNQLQLNYARQAASYYLQLASLKPKMPETGGYVYLAAQALETGDRSTQAIQMYERSAYDEQAFKNQAESAYAALVLYARIEKDLAASWSSAHEQSTRKFLSRYPLHAQASTVALRSANILVSQSRPDEALLMLSDYAKYAGASELERYAAARLESDLYYNAERFAAAEISYRKALAIQSLFPASDKRTKLVGELRSSLANTIFQLALAEQVPELKVQQYLRLEKEFPKHELASAAIYDAAAVDIAQANWGRASKLLEVFSERYLKHPLFSEARQKLIYVYEQNGDQLSAAVQLMLQAQATSDIDLAGKSAYQAAQHYQTLELYTDAAASYRWFINRKFAMPSLLTEALYFFVAYADEIGGVDKYKEGEAFLKYLESEGLDDARSVTLGSEVALSLAKVERIAFEKISLDLPFRSSLARKSKQLRRTTESYERVLAFGVKEYLSAARYNMAYAYQTLAHDIMSSERPQGLNDLEMEQYQILLEEQAIPIEEQAIDLHKLNVSLRERGVIDPYIQKSFEALAGLNPSLYERPIEESSHAPTMH